LVQYDGVTIEVLRAGHALDDPAYGHQRPQAHVLGGHTIELARDPAPPYRVWVGPYTMAFAGMDEDDLDYGAAFLVPNSGDPIGQSVRAFASVDAAREFFLRTYGPQLACNILDANGYIASSHRRMWPGHWS
jgi:hypothetical protein